MTILDFFFFFATCLFLFHFIFLLDLFLLLITILPACIAYCLCLSINFFNGLSLSLFLVFYFIHLLEKKLKGFPIFFPAQNLQLCRHNFLIFFSVTSNWFRNVYCLTVCVRLCVCVLCQRNMYKQWILCSKLIHRV